MRAYLAGLLIFPAVAGCNDAPTEGPPPERARVVVEANNFTPQTVRVRQGGVVEFTFLGTAHSVIFTEQPGRPDNIETPLANTTEERVFGTIDTYSYRCAEHTNMTGTVVVDAFTPTDGNEG